jgi:hypothetical protein
MKPLSDSELTDLLHQWCAPNAPATLDDKFFPLNPPLSWWQRLFEGSIKVPVPIGVLAVVILFSLFATVSWRSDRPGRTVTLADFQPVRQLQPRIIRSGYEGN